ncbi:inosose dehydratase [Aequitasia blattaphilus]|uniref:Sugar phosphate isomerase/epimerase n=1 Tax=Aequitasia blattaphilus TaxID=2949332 RepID=A0ABT1EGY4_9FIRM|nr:sugar phosphate isomerase/epimerase [Aequitasia blattaphilus]MCP1103687.1 sugar phosphate isomerase/epimerase [Aequitasia blattaphilus]MCR8616327.1 sugar phosphate isomerase/epimerase [Aequitasia blattaphilus]
MIYENKNLRKLKKKRKENYKDMRLGYMTNAFGPLVGDGAGVTSVKDIRYLTMGDDEQILKQITEVGFKSIEVLEGNLTKYSGDLAVLKDMLMKYDAELMSVCVGANFIYKDALEDEMYHMEAVAKAAKEVGATYIALCGGAIRGKGIQDGDYKLLGAGLDEARKVFDAYDLEASYHPHLGSMAESPDQIDKLFDVTNIAICPDLAHLAAGGGNPLEIVKKYYDRISFMHLKDLDDNGFAPLGTGRIDIVSILDYLKEKGYKGDYLVEIDGYAGDPLEACRVSYDFLKGKLF